MNGCTIKTTEMIFFGYQDESDHGNGIDNYICVGCNRSDVKDCAGCPNISLKEREYKNKYIY